MGVVKQTVVEMILLAALSAGLAFGYNAVRKDGRISPTKNYFARGDKPAGPAVDATRTQPARASAAAPVAEKPAPANSGVAPPTAPKKHLDHPYREISFDEVQAVLDDPETQRGLNVFIDARKDEDFAEGHLPGAIPCFPYEVERCIDRVLAVANGADKVIVYCGGGDCEDSIFMCRELVNAGVPFEAIYLYAGGWKEWSQRGGASAKGASD